MTAGPGEELDQPVDDLGPRSPEAGQVLDLRALAFIAALLALALLLAWATAPGRN